MTEKQSKLFFKNFGTEHVMSVAGADFTVEELYQAIYRRLFDDNAIKRHEDENATTLS